MVEMRKAKKPRFRISGPLSALLRRGANRVLLALWICIGLYWFFEISIDFFVGEIGVLFVVTLQGLVVATGVYFVRRIRVPLALLFPLGVAAFFISRGHGQGQTQIIVFSLMVLYVLTVPASGLRHHIHRNQFILAYSILASGALLLLLNQPWPTPLEFEGYTPAPFAFATSLEGLTYSRISDDSKRYFDVGDPTIDLQWESTKWLGKFSAYAEVKPKARSSLDIDWYVLLPTGADVDRSRGPDNIIDISKPDRFPTSLDLPAKPIVVHLGATVDPGHVESLEFSFQWNPPVRQLSLSQKRMEVIWYHNQDIPLRNDEMPEQYWPAAERKDSSALITFSIDSRTTTIPRAQSDGGRVSMSNEDRPIDPTRYVPSTSLETVSWKFIGADQEGYLELDVVDHRWEFLSDQIANIMLLGGGILLGLIWGPLRTSTARTEADEFGKEDVDSLETSQLPAKPSRSPLRRDGFGITIGVAGIIGYMLWRRQSRTSSRRRGMPNRRQ
jgi:hypothetical protein